MSTSSSDHGSVLGRWNPRQSRSFFLQCVPDINVEETQDGVLSFSSIQGFRTRLTTGQGPARELATRLGDGIEVSAMTREYRALADREKAVFDEILQALSERRMVALAWRPVDRIAATFETPAGLPVLPAIDLQPDRKIRLSRLALVHRIGSRMVLDFPPRSLRLEFFEAPATGFITALDGQRTVGEIIDGAPGHWPGQAIEELLGALVGNEIAEIDDLGRPGSPEDVALRQWECHDLFFYGQSHSGLGFSQLGAVPGASGIATPPPLRDSGFSGKAVSLPEPRTVDAGTAPGLFQALATRRSVREFDHENPVTIEELSSFLHYAARIAGTTNVPYETDAGMQEMEVAFGASPTAGGSSELRLYLGIFQCAGINPGVYRYDAFAHQLLMVASAEDGQWMARDAARSMMQHRTPPIVLAVSARFQRMNWKYRGIAFANILRDVGALYQTFYLTAAGLALGGCAIGNVNVRNFERLSGLSFHLEGAVGMFVLGRPGQIKNDSGI